MNYPDRPLPREALARHRNELVEMAERFRLSNVRVFGSVARREDTPDCDLDILVTRFPGTGLLTVAGFEEAASALLKVEVHVMTDGGFAPDHEIPTTAVPVKPGQRQYSRPDIFAER